MKEEELDWKVYHLLLQDREMTVSALAEAAQVALDDIKSSLKRLQSYLLIEQHGSEIRILSLQEMLIKCQCRHSDRFPLKIENGVVKVIRDGDS